MASVEELLLAARAKKSPLQALLEGGMQGFSAIQQRALQYEIDPAVQAEKQARQRAAERDKKLRAEMESATEAATRQAFNGVKPDGTPAHPAKKIERKLATDKYGYLDEEIKIVESDGNEHGGAAPTAMGQEGQFYTDPSSGMKFRIKPGHKGPELIPLPGQAMGPAGRVVYTSAEKQEGKIIPPGSVLGLNEGKSVARLLPEVENALLQNAEIFGPVGGRARSFNPYDERAQTIDARMRSASQMFGRFMEGGVLRKEDEEKYRKMFPQLADTSPIAKNKLSMIRRMLAQKYEDDRKTLGASGYDISGFEKLQIPASLFDASAPASGESAQVGDIALTGDKAKRLEELRRKAAQGGLK